MVKNKEDLKLLLEFISKILEQEENGWFKENLKKVLLLNNNSSFSQVDEIYEYCLKKIIKDHSEKFYEDFKLKTIKQKLIADFVRMEKFRREDNFEDFCLALFQQIEGIVNELSNEQIYNHFIDNHNVITHKVKDKLAYEYVDQKLWQLIFYPGMNEEDLTKKLSKKIYEWDFMERFKLILYYYFYNKKIYNYQDFLSTYFLSAELYQSRNLNHRGGKTSEKQRITIEKVNANSHKYYFKFLGFLEDFVSSLNRNI